MKDYLFRNNLSVKQLAGDLEISTSYLYQLIRGERKPSLELAKKIETITEGQVTVRRLLGFDPSGADEVFQVKHGQRIQSLEDSRSRFEEKIEAIESRLSKLEERN